MVATQIELIYGVVVKLRDLGRALGVPDDEIDDWKYGELFGGTKLEVDGYESRLDMRVLGHDHAETLSQGAKNVDWVCIGYEFTTLDCDRYANFGRALSLDEIAAAKTKFDAELITFNLITSGSTTTNQESSLIRLITNETPLIHFVRNGCMCCT